MSTKAIEVQEGSPVEWKKYDTYHVKVNPDQDDRATEIKLFSAKRPHMRAFHVCWFSFFMAFFSWFAVSPLLPEIKKSLKLTKHEVFVTSVLAVTGTFFVRFALGPFNDKFGPRWLMAAVLCLGSIPVALVGLVDTYHGLIAIRFFISVLGSSFVMCQYWMSRMYAKEIVGTANALAAGWGNLGGGVTLLVMGRLLFPLFQNIYDGNATKAWRTVCVIPAVITFFTGIIGYYCSDDAPKGNFADLKKHGTMTEVSAAASLRTGATNFNSWVLFFHYACTFGVELVMDNAATSYFHDEFGLTTGKAAAIASIFGWMNVFSRALGGYVSDLTNARWGMRGRLYTQMITILVQGSLILIFSKTNSLGISVFVMILFSIFCQGGCGTTFGIVPYVNPAATGSISGIVGAGGNAGAIAFNLVFVYKGYRTAFEVMGWCVFATAFTTVLLNIEGHRTLLGGHDTVPAGSMKETTIEVPEPATSKQLSDDEEDDDIKGGECEL